MKLKLSPVILALTINLPLLFTNVQAVYGQNQSQTSSDSDGDPEFVSDLLPPLSPVSEINIVPEIKPYSLDKGDIIRVAVFGLPEQGGIAPVFRDGTVTFPLIGNVMVKGKTIAEVNEMMTQLYSLYLKRPAITVTLEQPRPLNVAIVGEVNVPGNYTISGSSSSTLNNTQSTNTTTPQAPKITDLFSLAGGLTVSADVKQIKLKRIENNRQVLYNLDFWKLLQEGDLAQDAFLQDGDVIMVTKQDDINPKEYKQLIDANFGIKYIKPPNVTIVGEVNRPGAYVVPIADGPPRLTTILQQSGGIRELADVRNIKVTRTTRDAQEQIIEVNLWDMLLSGDIKRDIILREGDTIEVPMAESIDPTEAQILASANFSPEQIVVNVVGSVVRPGPLAIRPNSSLNAALLNAGGFNEPRAKKSSIELVRVNPNGSVTKRTISVDLGAEVNEENNPILKNNDVIIVDRNALTVVTDSLNSTLAPFTSVFSFVRLFSIFGF